MSKLPSLHQFRPAASALALALSLTDALSAQETAFLNEATDTTRITRMLVDESSREAPGNVERIARLFLDTPYAAGTLEHNEKETLTVNLDSLDCTTFVETVLALAYTSREGRQSWRDFTYNLRRIRYRHGEVNGYASRLHYISEWIVDNIARGNIIEITSTFSDVKYGVKSLDYMTSHHNAYPALADSANFAAMKNVEAGLSNHRYPYLKGNSLKAKKLAEQLQPGDIICFTTATKGLDVTHMAIVTIIDKVPHIIHASRSAGKVAIDPLPLTDYVRRNRNEGIRILRLRVD